MVDCTDLHIVKMYTEIPSQEEVWEWHGHAIPGTARAVCTATLRMLEPLVSGWHFLFFTRSCNAPTVPGSRRIRPWNTERSLWVFFFLIRIISIESSRCVVTDRNLLCFFISLSLSLTHSFLFLLTPLLILLLSPLRFPYLACLPFPFSPFLSSSLPVSWGSR